MSDLTAGQLLTADQVADRWGVTKQYVWYLTREGRLPVCRFGPRNQRYRLQAIEAFEIELETGGE